jgi:hypothetical protein
MKSKRITITHQVEKTQHHFMVVDPDKLSSSEVDRIKKVKFNKKFVRFQFKFN